MRFHLSRNPEVKPLLEEAQEFFEQHLSDWLDDDVVVCMGGDGTLLHAFHTYGLSATYFPLNYGTRGYLTNRSLAPQEIVDLVQVGEIKYQSYSVLDSGKSLAFNEVGFKAVSGQASRLNICVNGYPLTSEPLVGDGVIIHTAQGSTGWAYSAGATCISPEIPGVIGITPVCSYHPRPAPVVLDTGAVITIEAEDAERRPVKMLVDGQKAGKLKPDQVVQVTVPAETVKMIYLSSHDFRRRIISKVVR